MASYDDIRISSYGVGWKEEMKRFIKDTVFFFSKSKAYMSGQKTTPLAWAKAYIKFMRLSHKDSNEHR